MRQGKGFIAFTNRILCIAFPLAVVGMLVILGFSEGADPRTKPWIYIALITGLPLTAIMASRMVYNLLAGVHSTLEKAGLMASWAGLAEWIVTALVFFYVGEGQDEMITRIIYATLVLVGAFLTLLGDLLRHHALNIRSHKAP